MPNFFRNLFFAQPETEEEFALRMEQLYQHMDDLSKSNLIKSQETPKKRSATV